MESLKQLGALTQPHNGKTLVIGRQFDVGSSAWLGDANQDRRQSAMSLNRKRPKARPRQREPSDSPPPPPKSSQLLNRWSKASPPTTKPKPNANQLLAKWNKVSQPIDDDDSSDGDLPFTLSGTSKTTARPTGGIKKLTLRVSPETRTSTLPTTSRGASDTEPEYLFVSQDGTQVSSSAPRKDLLLEVSIGTGDGSSVASAERESFFPSRAAPASGFASGFLRDGSIGYSSDSEGGRRDDSFLGDHRRRPLPGKRVRLESESPSEGEVEVRKIVKGKGKTMKRVVESTKRVEPTRRVEKSGLMNLTRIATTKRDSSKRKAPPAPPAPPPKSKPKKRVVLDSSESDHADSTSDAPTPRAQVKPSTKPSKGALDRVRRDKSPPSKRRKATEAGRDSKRGNKRKRVTLDEDPTITSASDDDTDRPPVRRKLGTGKGKAPIRTPVKEKKKSKHRPAPAPAPAPVAIPSGFPSPMRAPVRVNEALLAAPAAPKEDVRKKYRLNAAGEQEEIVYGPNGAEPLPLSECCFSDRPTVQLAEEKIPQLIARKIIDEKCPYCNNFLPAHMSASTEELFDKLRSSRPSNSTDNDWTRTIEFCERHQAESYVFPLGLHAGYPAEMNFTELRQRIKKMKPDVRRMLKRPKDSPFYLFAKRDLERQGRRKWAGTEARNDEQRKNRLLPGYFGPLGKLTMASVLRGMLRSHRFARLVTSKAIDPLDVEEYIEHVLVLEVAVHLISEDMAQYKEDNEPLTDKEKRAQALKILKESREFGRLRFGIGSEYLAHDDLGNGATQMVIADVRRLHDDSDEESAEDEATSSDADVEDEAQGQGTRNGMTLANDAISSPQRIDDDDDDIRPAATPDVLPLDSSPVQSVATRRSQSPEAIIVDPPTPSRNTVSQIDKSLAPVSFVDDLDDFDGPGESLDAQALIDAANGIEESHYQQEKRKNNAQTNRNAKRPPRFAKNVVDVISPERPASATGGARNGSESSRLARNRDSGTNQDPIVHDLDDDEDPLAENLSSHRNLVSRTQTRQTSQIQRVPAQSSALGRQTGTNGVMGSTRVRIPSRRFDDEPVPSYISPYHHSSTPQGTRRLGLARSNATGSTAGPGAQNGSRQAEARDKTGPSLFMPKKRNQALEHREERTRVYEGQQRGGRR